MRDFSDLGAFATFLASRVTSCETAVHNGVYHAAEIVLTESRSLIGQEGVTSPGDAPWAELADLTVYEKTRLGYINRVSPTDPLLREGDLRASIGMEARENEAVVGSDSQIAIYQELGTSTIPPRSFLASAAVRKINWAVDAMAVPVWHALAGEPPSNRPPGVDDP